MNLTPIQECEITNIALRLGWQPDHINPSAHAALEWLNQYAPSALANLTTDTSNSTEDEYFFSHT